MSTAAIDEETRFALAKNESFKLSDVRDHVLSCVHGELWITVDGESDDPDRLVAPRKSVSWCIVGTP